MSPLGLIPFILPSVPKSSLFFLPELLEMSANEAEEAVSYSLRCVFCIINPSLSFLGHYLTLETGKMMQKSLLCTRP